LKTLMIQAYILDDEPLALSRLARLLAATGRVEVVGESCDPEDAITFLNSHSVDVVFTDIQMPGLTGFQMLAKLEAPPFVVFTTAYSDYALQAFEVSAIDYLVKPVDSKQLERALNHVDRIRSGVEPRQRLESLLNHLAATLPKPKSHPSRLPSRVGDKTEFFEVARVTHFYANDKLTYAATAKKDYIVDRTITDLEGMLDEERFVRIHRSTIVNLEFVKELHSWFAERLMVRLNDGKDTELTVARDRVKRLKEKLGL
jgi:two-component system LytT family response regulator